ncbi:hypothetical protein GDO78_010749 [Eleutherodactylus coqui]|uniref:Uncharacterized protein n=1 Tax=Eleutherodactylus coqui TaxID=57060 RepID=A0A8J6F6Y7_ELECQ|nr:hypothetical protein GDO78_010749 [Eleutherodactylus coqui]
MAGYRQRGRACYRRVPLQPVPPGILLLMQQRAWGLQQAWYIHCTGYLTYCLVNTCSLPPNIVGSTFADTIAGSVRCMTFKADSVRRHHFATQLKPLCDHQLEHSGDTPLDRPTLV